MKRKTTESKKDYKILRNPIYAGYIHKPEWEINYIVGLHEPIITQEIYFTNQDILADKKIKKKKIDKYNPEFPLKKFVYCAECNIPFTASKSRSKTKKRYSYYHGYLYCKHRYRKEKLEQDFIDLLNRYQPKEFEIDLFKEILIDSWKQKEQIYKNKIKSLQKKLNMNKINMDKIEELVITVTFNQETYQKNYEKYYQEKVEIEIEINKSNTQLNENLEQLIKLSFDILYNLSDFWINSDIKTKIEFENLLFPEGWFTV